MATNKKKIFVTQTMSPGARAGGPLRLAVDLNNMHLLNEGTGAVI